MDLRPLPPPAAARAAVTWEGPGELIVLTLYGPDGEVALSLLPKRALTLAQELLTAGVSAIKADPEAPVDPRMSRSACWGRPSPARADQDVAEALGRVALGQGGAQPRRTATQEAVRARRNGRRTWGMRL